MSKTVTVCNELAALKTCLEYCDIPNRKLLAVGLCLSCQGEIMMSIPQHSSTEEFKLTYLRKLMGFPVYVTSTNCFSCKLQEGII